MPHCACCTATPSWCKRRWWHSKGGGCAMPHDHWQCQHKIFHSSFFFFCFCTCMKWSCSLFLLYFPAFWKPLCLLTLIVSTTCRLIQKNPSSGHHLALATLPYLPDAREVAAQQRRWCKMPHDHWHAIFHSSFFLFLFCTCMMIRLFIVLLYYPAEANMRTWHWFAWPLCHPQVDFKIPLSDVLDSPHHHTFWMQGKVASQQRRWHAMPHDYWHAIFHSWFFALAQQPGWLLFLLYFLLPEVTIPTHIDFSTTHRLILKIPLPDTTLLALATPPHLPDSRKGGGTAKEVAWMPHNCLQCQHAIFHFSFFATCMPIRLIIVFVVFSCFQSHYAYSCWFFPPAGW